MAMILKVSAPGDVGHQRRAVVTVMEV